MRWRKLLLATGASLEDWSPGPGGTGPVGWGLPPEDPVLKQRKLGWMDDVGLHLMGRATYEGMAELRASHWEPSRSMPTSASG
jgi:hypothetical protein